MSDDALTSLTVAFKDGDVEIEELGKVVLAASPAWATVAFLSREKHTAADDFGPPRISLRRYKKRGGKFITDKHFTLNSEEQVRALAGAIASWFPASPK